MSYKIWKLSLFALMVSCGGSSSGFKVDYLDQDVAGKVADADFTYVSGYAEISDLDSTKLYLKLGAVAPADPCAFGADFGTTEIFGSVPDEVQANTLKLDLSGGTSQTMTMYDGETNWIASKGEIEILSRSDTLVTGRMHIAYDDENEVNGNFSVTFCP